MPVSSPAIAAFSLRSRAKTRVDFPAEIPIHVDEVHAGFENQQLRHRAEVRLPCQVGIGLPAVAHPRATRERVQAADRVPVEQAAKLAVPRLKTEVVVHHEPDARPPGLFDNDRRFADARRQRLLAENVDTTLRGEPRQRQMRVRRSDDVDEVGALDVEHLRHVGVRPRHVEFAGDTICARPIAIADSHELGARHARPGIVVELAEVPRANGDAAKHAPHALYHFSTTLSSTQPLTSASNARKCGIVRCAANAASSS